MQQRIERFLAGVHAGDVALLYYSGHGMQIDGENLLVPVDFPDPPESQAPNACIRLDKVQRDMEKAAAGLSIVIMDACRDNPYKHGRAWARGMAPPEAGLGSYVAFAASPGHTADDNSSERNGLFTKYLLAGLNNPPPLSQLFRGVRDAVYQSSNRYQQPYLVDQVIGDFWFRKSAAVAAAVTEQPQQTTPRAEGLLEEGVNLYYRGMCVEALERFDRAVRMEPENAFAQNAAGMAYLCRSQYAPAIERFNMAIQLQPAMAAAYLNRGSAYMTAAKFELAVEDFSWAIDQDPDNPVVYVRRGRARFNMRKYDEALADFRKAIELNPADAEAFHGRGQVLQRLGRYKEAETDYVAALERKRNFPDARRDLDAVQQRLGRRQP
jgi:tetratricopeptide (TPR) repeat protein